MFGLVRRVQPRYSLSETTLQQGNFRGMVHTSIVLEIDNKWYSIYIGPKKIHLINKGLLSINVMFYYNEIFLLKKDYSPVIEHYYKTTIRQNVF